MHCPSNMWRLSNRNSLVLATLFITLASASCGDSTDAPELATVRGQVTLDGEPLSHGTVYFMPDDSRGTQGPMSIGEIGENGQYELTSAGDRKGAVVGSHRIRVESRQKPKDFRDTEPPSLIPEHYNDPGSSELMGTVASDTDNVIDLTLKSQP